MDRQPFRTFLQTDLADRKLGNRGSNIGFGERYVASFTLARTNVDRVDRFVKHLCSVLQGLLELSAINHFNSSSHSYTDLSNLSHLHCQNGAPRELEEHYISC